MPRTPNHYYWEFPRKVELPDCVATIFQSFYNHKKQSKYNSKKNYIFSKLLFNFFSSKLQKHDCYQLWLRNV